MAAATGPCQSLRRPRTAILQPPRVPLRNRSPAWTPLIDMRMIAPRNAPVAQLDRVPPSEGGGRGFESRLVRHISLIQNIFKVSPTRTSNRLSPQHSAHTCLYAGMSIALKAAYRPFFGPCQSCAQIVPHGHKPGYMSATERVLASSGPTWDGSPPSRGKLTHSRHPRT